MDYTKARLVTVLAHPDDETFGMGGTLAHYARLGASVYLICATRGEVGEMDPKLMEGFNSIAEKRETELRQIFYYQYPTSEEYNHLNL
jgi:LmbE family N-acetylglucosaminyl deacetylase